MRVLADGRVRRTEAEWRVLAERLEKSGLSMTAFSSRAKLSRSSFVKWRGRLGGKPAAKRSARSSPAFVEWMAPLSAEASPERLGVARGEGSPQQRPQQRPQDAGVKPGAEDRPLGRRSSVWGEQHQHRDAG